MERCSRRAVCRHKTCLQRIRKELLVWAKMSKTQSSTSITLDIRSKPGGISGTLVQVVDCTGLQTFLTSLVSNGEVEAVESALQSFEALASDSWEVCPTLAPGEVRCVELEVTAAGLVNPKPKLAGVGGRNSQAKRNYRLNVGQSSMSTGKIEFELPIACALTCRQKLINSRCHGPCRMDSHLTLLNCAILCSRAAMVEFLVQCGADVHIPAAVFSDGSCWLSSPLHLAVLTRQPEIVRYLFEQGASPLVPLRQYSCTYITPRPMFCLDLMKTISTYSLCQRRNTNEFLALCSSPRFPPPFLEAARAYLYMDEDMGQLLRRRIRWNVVFDRTVYVSVMQHWQQWTSLLEIPCYTEEEIMAKMYFCLLILRRVCTARLRSGWSIVHDRPVLKERGLLTDHVNIVNVVRYLLQQVTDPTGMSSNDVETIQDIPRDHWRLSSKICVGNFHKTFTAEPGRDPTIPTLQCLFGECVDLHLVFPDSSPIIERGHLPRWICVGAPLATLRLLCCKSVDDNVFKLLFFADGIPGIRYIRHIPFVDGRLHDGPSCKCGIHLDQERRKVSAADVLTPARPPRSLLQLCRTTILRACQSHVNGVAAAISELSLPQGITDILLFR
eukprot:scpid66277/ scgid9608/ 